ncbi:hypothetical protein ACFXO9_02025 [Nocardia tengchongensis]|uniref:hypothetical protein n=1 Tax=Nocardia tengchongensis TaxID=2055889 RepID=UPI0036AC8863
MATYSSDLSTHAANQPTGDDESAEPTTPFPIRRTKPSQRRDPAPRTASVTEDPEGSSEPSSPEDDHARATELVRSKLRTVRGLDPDKATRRLVGLLARRGFSPSTAYSVVKTELSAADLG